MTLQALSDGRYDSVTAFLDAVNSHARNNKNEKRRQRWFSEHENDGWLGAECKSGADVLRLVRDGWQEGRNKVDAFLALITDGALVPRDRRRRLTRGDFGDTVHMGDVYAGRFQTAWTCAQRRETIGQQRVDICANMICSGGDNADVLLWRGVAAVALADKLALAGFMVRIVVGFGGEIAANSEQCSCRITIKDHAAPLDVSTASAVLLPGFFRALGHAWACGHSVANADSGSMSVRTCKLDDGEIFLSHEVRSEASALAWVNAQIAKLDGSTSEQAA